MDVDPIITLRSAIISGWNGDTDLDAAIDTCGDYTKEVLCAGTWFDEEYNKKPQISIRELLSRDQPFELGYGVIREFNVYQFDIWVPILRESAKGPEAANLYYWQIKKEMKRILKANLTGLTDIKYVILDRTGVDLPERDRNPQLEHFSLRALVVRDY